MKDNIVFAIYKDESIGSTNNFRSKVKKFIKDINVNDVYLRIINYQIDKYGEPLTDEYWGHATREFKKMSKNAYERKRMRLRG